MYEKYIKRLLDMVVSFCAIIILIPVLIVIWLLVRLFLGHPTIFTQSRFGKDMKIVNYHKFRSMTSATDSNGRLLPDEQRLTKLGKILRSTSLDELPQLFDILTGKMSIVGPRPQSIPNILFMSKEQQKRQNVIPGLTGLAQVNGRNAIDWDSRVRFDLQYIEKITFFGDLSIIFQTVGYVFARKDINQDHSATYETMGEFLIRKGKLSKESYQKRLLEIEAQYASYHL